MKNRDINESAQRSSRTHGAKNTPELPQRLAASRRACLHPQLPASILPRPSRILPKLLPAMLQQPRVQLQHRSREFYACTPSRDTRAPTTCGRRRPELLHQVAPSVSTLRHSTLNGFHSVAAEPVSGRCSRVKARLLRRN